jgi:hypothetical protein
MAIPTVRVKMTYKVQIDDKVRNANAEEIALIEATLEETAVIESDRIAREVARAALLNRLGISADEAKLLLG